jgi:hypothetical protein
MPQSSKHPPKRPHVAKAEIARRIAEAGARALAEAETRKNAAGAAGPGPKELGGQAGPEPTRYGDWEKKGVISDF